MFITQVHDLLIHVVEVKDKWAFIIDNPQKERWNGYVSETFYDDQEKALKAGIEFINHLEKNVETQPPTLSQLIKDHDLPTARQQ